MTVAILTMFTGLDTTYSLVGAVAEQITMLLKAGIDTRVLVSEDCPDAQRQGVFADPRVQWVKITNRLDGKTIVWRDYSMPEGELHDSFFAEAEAIAADFQTALEGVCVCILHDILYQGWHLVHNAALRLVQAKRSDIRFLAFTHSAPVNRPADAKPPFSYRYTSMPNTLYVYPTQSGIPALARQYGVPEGKCRVVYNSLDPLRFTSDSVRSIHAKTNLLAPDILIIAPGRLSPGKQFEKVAALAGAIRAETETSVQVVFCDFPCADVEANTYKQLIRATGRLCGLNEDGVIFTSDIGFPHGVPREAVLELMTLSNLYICPSRSESFGLTVLEAAGRGNFLVLNEAVPALAELGRRFSAYFMRWNARNFGFDTREDYKPGEIQYLKKHAVEIVSRMRANPVLSAKTSARRDFCPDWIWYHQLQPLLGKDA